MASDRRSFLSTAPLLALGLGELAEKLLAAAPSSNADLDALNFWLYGIGIPREQIPAAGAYTRAGAKGPQSSINREPIFLHYDETKQVLVLSDKIPPESLLTSGDAQVDFQMQRLRLNAEDEKQFSKYASGGIYMDMQQHPDVSPSGTDSRLSIAASIFSAFFPGASKGTAKNGESGGGRSGQSKVSGKSQGSPQGTPGAPAPAGQSVALQQGSQSQSLSLSNGLGKAMFVAFVKDRHQSVFGQFINTIAGSGASSYSPLLSIPFMAAPALTAIRAIVANLQINGGNQAVIMQSLPVSLAATADAMQAGQDVLPVRSGSYIAVPQEHGSLIKNQLDKLKIVKGFLVPKEIDPLDVNDDVVAHSVPGVSYLSLGVNVKKVAKGARCAAPEA